ncbi:MAG TPA: hypothetical protein VKP69_20125 [Isosphaeraceae bacterium]|nr:hypothetical protein [Isosphaeraceae bacterium]
MQINIREKGQDGEIRVRWAVKHQPGPLAYKLDTLIVNRRIEEATRPVPKVIRIGTLRQICRELGISEGKGTQNVKGAIYQNAEAFITAKTKYRLKEGGERTIEAGFSRYSVIFTGEELPDGRRADAVYILLNEIYMQVLNGAMTRPLDYDYLKDLPPASQRFYEILSYQVFAALKHKRPYARLVYSDLCTYAPQTRYFDYDRVKRQMYKVHAPHRQSGYIKAVQFELTTDAEGRADWVMIYTPGPKARAEYHAFTKRGGPVVLELEPPLLEWRDTSELKKELVLRGVSEKTAQELVLEFPEARIRQQIEQADWLKKKETHKITNLGAYLTQAVRNDYAPPEGFESKAAQTERESAQAEQQRREAEATRQKWEREQRGAAARAKVLEHWKSLSLAEQEAVDAEALAAVDQARREEYRQFRATRNPVAGIYLRSHIREPFLRAKLGLSQEDAAQD